MWIALIFAFVVLGFLLIAFGHFDTTANLFALMCFLAATGVLYVAQDYPATNKNNTSAEKIERACMCECVCEE